MKGRKPRPHALRLVSVRPDKQKREAAKRAAAPSPTHDIGDPPDWLSGRQRAIWRHVAMHMPPGVLKQADCAVLAAYCVAVDMHRDAAERLEAEGLTIIGRDGGTVRNPLLMALTQSATAMMRAAAELGLTPTARVRLAVPGADEPRGDDDYDF